MCRGPPRGPSWSICAAHGACFVARGACVARVIIESQCEDLPSCEMQTGEEPGAGSVVVVVAVGGRREGRCRRRSLRSTGSPRRAGRRGCCRDRGVHWRRTRTTTVARGRRLLNCTGRRSSGSTMDSGGSASSGWPSVRVLPPARCLPVFPGAVVEVPPRPPAHGPYPQRRDNPAQPAARSVNDGPASNINTTHCVVRCSHRPRPRRPLVIPVAPSPVRLRGQTPSS